MNFTRRADFAVSRNSSYQPIQLTDIAAGFTTLELRNIEAFAPVITDDVDLSMEGMPIHPMYTKKNWDIPSKMKHNPDILVGDGGKGYYLVKLLALHVNVDEH